MGSGDVLLDGIPNVLECLVPDLSLCSSSSWGVHEIAVLSRLGYDSSGRRSVGRVHGFIGRLMRPYFYHLEAKRVYTIAHGTLGA